MRFTYLNEHNTHSLVKLIYSHTYLLRYGLRKNKYNSPINLSLIEWMAPQGEGKANSLPSESCNYTQISVKTTWGLVLLLPVNKLLHSTHAYTHTPHNMVGSERCQYQTQEPLELSASQSRGILFFSLPAIYFI